MILYVRNKTQVSIPELNLSPGESTAVFYNRQFFLKRSEIYNNLYSDKIEFLNEENESFVYLFNGDIFNNDYLVNHLSKFNEVDLSDFENLTRLELEIGQEILLLIHIIFRKANVQGYTKSQYFTAMGTLPEMLRFGFVQNAGNYINNISTDSFFTVNRKSKFKEICDSVNLN